MKVTTIGFTQKSAERFFSLLKQAEVRTVLDVRLNKTSQLAGFAKKLDLELFLSELLDVKYLDLRELAPERKPLQRIWPASLLGMTTQRRILSYSRSGESRATWTLRYSTEVAFFTVSIGQTVAIEYLIHSGQGG